MSTKQMSDNVFDALFGQAVIDNFYNELDSLPTAEELAIMYKPSEAHAIRMKKLFAAEKRKERIHTVLVWSKRVAAVITIATTILFGSLMFVPEVRAAVVETIIEWYEQFTRFTSTSTNVDKTDLEPEYIPDGFEEEMRSITESITIILYTNEYDEVITFQSSLSEGSLAVDNEGRDYEVKSVDDVDYHIFTAGDNESENTILWDRHGQRYFVTSTIPIDELLTVVLSVP